MEPGDTIHAAQLAGSFTLPANPDTKLAFLAGGIGITPFRSMLQYLLDRKERRGRSSSSTATKRQQDIAYRDVLDAARRELGIRTVHAVARGARRGQYPGYIDARLVRAAIPDYRERTFYISGPQAMVKALRQMLARDGRSPLADKGRLLPGLCLKRRLNGVAARKSSRPGRGRRWPCQGVRRRLRRCPRRWRGRDRCRRPCCRAGHRATGRIADPLQECRGRRRRRQ